MAEVYDIFAVREQQERWREHIDLGTADRMTVYAAGREDGYRQAITEFKEMWELLLQLHSAPPIPAQRDHVRDAAKVMVSA